MYWDSSAPTAAGSGVDLGNIGRRIVTENMKTFSSSGAAIVSPSSADLSNHALHHDNMNERATPS